MRGKRNLFTCCKVLWLILFISIISACSSKSELNEALEYAGNNRIELLKVLEYYKKVDNKDTLKLEAAFFLIKNMPQHYSLYSDAIGMYQTKVHKSDTLIDMETLNGLWKDLESKNELKAVFDARILKADFLIENIDKSFAVWYSSPWKEKIDFNLFCQYILPYRFQNELLPISTWRDSLYNEYHPLIDNVKDMQKAFAIIKDTVWSQLASSSSKFSYVINVLDLKHQKKATCIQRCIVLGSVLRALGLPVAIDHVGRWANYSKHGHAWVALITKEGPYTFYRDETEAKLNNRIDASLFIQDYKVEKDYPLATDFKKRFAKITRSSYNFNHVPEELDLNWEAVYLLSDPFSNDVSREYHLNDTVNIETNNVSDHAYLCTFATARDWEPVSFSKIIEGKCCFPNMGDSIVYLPVIYTDKMEPIGYPFIALKNSKSILRPNYSDCGKVILTRKYPLTGSWINAWGAIVGARLEGSNDPDFRQKEVLYTIDIMPVFRNEINFSEKKNYRYVRYVSPPNCSTPMAELECWSNNVILQGNSFGINSDKTERCFDGNNFTILGGQKKGYIFGIDFGTPQTLTKLVYYPKNDGNFVIPNHRYELFYYDMKWISLGEKQAMDFQLVYDNVPSNALLLLKDLTEGKEERIFTYKTGKQLWW